MKYWILLLALLCSSSVMTAQKEKKSEIRKGKINNPTADSIYQARVKLAEIEGVYIPKDLYDCFAQLDKLMDEEVKAQFIGFADTEVDARTHLSLGKWIEHKWSLVEGSRLSAYFNKLGVPHPDYMVSIILVSYHRHLNKKDLDLKGQVGFYKDLWKKKQKTKPKE
jgi:hypothetical protein